MSRTLGLFVAAALAMPLVAHAQDYSIDGAHSSANFSVKHMMVSTVHGRFSNLKGTIHYDPQHVAQSTVNAVIDASTISTDNEKRDAHLKSPDFFDVAKFPTLTFVSKSVESAGQGKLKVTGDLTMHGVTKQVVLDVEGLTETVKDPWGNEKSGATATTVLSRKDFGLTWNKTLEKGAGLMVGDEVKIELDLELAAAKK